ncbi:EthD domain-containing protein [Variovorax sp. H27-G14]|uniref:EthD domain-containing protein n=1 Tax=Variovorax sp. H27-G14 TaxID=3111914 RepID=UPI0038FC0A1F
MTEPTTLRMGLIRKKPDWTDDAFRRHWRDSHGPLVAQLPALRAYRQNLVVDRLQRGIDFARGPWDFDGFSQLRFDAAAQADAAFTHGELAAAIRADEEHFLGALHIVTVAQTEVIALPPKPEGLLKRISLLRRPVAQSEEDFRREWRVHADHVRRMPGVSGYRQNVVTARELVKGTPCAHAELPIDGIVELWFENIDTLNAAFASPQGRVTMAHALTFLAEITAFVVQEHRVM